MLRTSKETKLFKALFFISNGLNFLYSVFLIIILAIFIIKNKIQDTFTITFVLFFCIYALVSVMGHLWIKKSLCINYLYACFIFFIYFVMMIFEWNIIFDVEGFKNNIISLFPNSKHSADLLYEYFYEKNDAFKILIFLNTLFMVIINY